MTNEQLVLLIKQGDKELYSELWAQNEKFFTAQMSKLYNKNREHLIAAGYEYTDIIQESYFIMLAMVEAFKSDKGIKFLSYFKLQAINHFNRIIFKKDRFGNDKDVINCAVSLYEEVKGFEGEEMFILDTLPDKAATIEFEAAESKIYNAERAKVFNSALKDKLSIRQEDIIRRIYYQNEKKSYIASCYGVTGEAIRQEEIKALHALRMSKELRTFEKEYISERAYMGTSLSSFLYNQGSSQERIIEKLEQLKQVKS